MRKLRWWENSQGVVENVPWIDKHRKDKIFQRCLFGFYLQTQ